MFAALGIHPHHAGETEEGYEGFLENSIKSNAKAVALGECGLDYHYDFCPKLLQKGVFLNQLEMARRLKVPVVLHVREPHADALEIMKDFGGGGQPDPLRHVVHCFTGTSGECERWLALGAYIGITGIVTYKNAEDVRAAAKMVPSDRLLVETDAPYLSPEPMRKMKVNEPSYVAHTAKYLAELRGVSEEELARQTTENAGRLFGERLLAEVPSLPATQESFNTKPTRPQEHEETLTRSGFEFEAVGKGDGGAGLGGDFGLVGEARPVSDGTVDLIQNAVGVADFELFGDGEEVGAGEVVLLAVDAHLVSVGPISGRVEGPDDVEGGGEGPGAGGAHEEGDVAGVVILVAGDDVEEHAAEELVEGGLAEVELLEDGEGLLVAGCAGGVEVEVAEGAEGLDVEFLAGGGAVEAAGHEVGASPVFFGGVTGVLLVFFKQATVGHFDAGGTGHEVVGEFDAAEAGGFAEGLLVGAVELEEPVLEAGRGGDLAGADFVGGRVPGDDGFGAGTAGGGADLDDFLEGLGLGGFEVDGELGAVLEDLGGEVGELGDFDGDAGALARADDGVEFQGAHGAGAHVAETFDGGKIPRGTALAGEPEIDEGVAETVGQGIGEEAWEAAEGLWIEAGEGVEVAGIGGHHERGDGEVLAGEGGGVLEGAEVAGRVPGDGTDLLVPEADDGGGYFLGACHGRSLGWGFGRGGWLPRFCRFWRSRFGAPYRVVRARRVGRRLRGHRRLAGAGGPGGGRVGGG